MSENPQFDSSFAYLDATFTQSYDDESTDVWCGLPEPTELGSWQLQELLGMGGWGIVYLAEQKFLGSQAAIKILKPALAKVQENRDLFYKEGKILKALENETNIVSISNLDSNGHYHWMELEYISGFELEAYLTDLGSEEAHSLLDDIEEYQQGDSLENIQNLTISSLGQWLTLQNQIGDGTLPEHIVKLIGINMVIGLAGPHKKGIVHRDVKPDNILLLDENGNIKLTDFGLGKLLGNRSGIEFDHTMHSRTTIKGTIKYTSPEQEDKSKDIDGRSDLFSLGIVLYQCLTGKLPRGRFELPSKMNPKINKQWDAVLIKALNPEPSERWQTAEAMGGALEKIKCQTIAEYKNQQQRERNKKKQEEEDRIAKEKEDEDKIRRDEEKAEKKAAKKLEKKRLRESGELSKQKLRNALIGATLLVVVGMICYFSFKQESTSVDNDSLDNKVVEKVVENIDSDALYPIQIRGKWGYLDRDDKVVIKPQWDNFSYFKDGMAIIKRGNQWGYIDKTGAETIKPQWQRVGPFSRDCAFVQLENGNWKMIDKSGKYKVDQEWEWMNWYTNSNEGGYAVKKDGKFGFVDTTGDLLIDYQWDEAHSFSEGLAHVRRGKYWGYIDKNYARSKKYVIEPNWDEANFFHEGVASVKKDGKWIFVDKTGKELTKLGSWAEADRFFQGLAKVKTFPKDDKPSKYGFIDKNGTMIIRPRWDEIRDFSEEHAVVKLNNKYLFLDRAGQRVVDPVWDNMFSFKNGKAWVSKGNFNGYIDREGNYTLFDMKPNTNVTGKTAGERREFEVAPGLSVAFRWCPAASFMMGSPKDEKGHMADETLREVKITKGFWMSETECTQVEWEYVMGNNPSKFKTEEKDAPVENILKSEVMTFFKRLRVPHGFRVTLPSEAQWEYACRAGDSEKLPFSTGKTINTDQANFNGESKENSSYLKKEANQESVNRKTTIKVRSFKPNRWGLYDMHGNVSEMCSDWFKQQKKEEKDILVFRGSHYGSSVEENRSAFQHRFYSERKSYGGFRFILSPMLDDEEKKDEYEIGMDRTSKIGGLYVQAQHAYKEQEWEKLDVILNEFKKLDPNNLNLPVWEKRLERQKMPLFPFQVKGKWGFMDRRGKKIITPRWQMATRFYNGLAIVKDNFKYGFIDKTGRILIKPEWDEVLSFNNGCASVRKGFHWGGIDDKGKIVIPLYWDRLWNFDDQGLACVKKNNKYGFINKKGKVVVKPEWDEVLTFSDGLVGVRKGTKYGFVNRAGDVVIKPMFEDVFSFSEGLAAVKKGNKYGFINLKGDVVIKPVWDRVVPFSEGLAAVKKGNKCGFINKNGEIEITLIYSNVRAFSEKLATVRLAGVLGCIGKKGRMAFHGNWDIIFSFKDGIAKVQKGDKFGFINNKGEVVVDIKWSAVSEFKNGLAMALVGRKHCYIDKTGKVIKWFTELDKTESEQIQHPLGIKKEKMAQIIEAGLLCQKGDELHQEDTSESRRKAVPFYEKAAKLGHAKANYMLGYYYDDGLGGLKPNDVASIQYYKAAILGKEKVARAAYNLGKIYARGLNGDVPDIVKSKEYFLIAHEIDGTDVDRELMKLVSQKLLSKVANYKKGGDFSKGNVASYSGFRRPIESVLKNHLSLKSVYDSLGVNLFTNNLHKKAFDFSDKKSFGNYNPKSVKLLSLVVMPAITAMNKGDLERYKKQYGYWLSAILESKRVIDQNREEFKLFKAAYKRVILDGREHREVYIWDDIHAEDAHPKSYYKGGKVNFIFEFPFQDKALPKKHSYHPFTYYFDTMNESADSAFFWWARREMDGSADEFEKLFLEMNKHFKVRTDLWGKSQATIDAENKKAPKAIPVE